MTYTDIRSPAVRPIFDDGDCFRVTVDATGGSPLLGLTIAVSPAMKKCNLFVEAVAADEEGCRLGIQPKDVLISVAGKDYFTSQVRLLSPLRPTHPRPPHTHNQRIQHERRAKLY